MSVTIFEDGANGRLNRRSPTPFNVGNAGATGDGQTDDYLAIRDASLSQGSTGALYFPPGTYRIRTNLTINCRAIFEFGATLEPDAGVTVTLAGPVDVASGQEVETSGASGTVDVTGSLSSSGYLVVQNVGGANGENLLWNPIDNAIASDIEASVISGGGNAANPQLIGYLETRNRFQGDGVNTTFTTTFDVTSASLVRVRLIRTDKVRVSVTSFCDITIVGGKAQVVYPRPGHFVNNATGGAEGTDPALLTTEQLEIVGITFTENPGSGSNYSGIYGGYDNVIQSGVMQHIIGAHHRIVNGDHNTIVGGSYARIEGGATYSVIAGGTGNEINTTGTGSLILGGNGNLIQTAGPGYIIGGSANTLSGVQAFIAGGSSNVVSGNGALVGGRENVVSGRDSLVGGFRNDATGVYAFAAGLDNLSSGSYSAVFGRDNVASGEGALALGRWASAARVGSLTIGAGRFAALGDAQTSVIPLRVQTTNATVTNMLAQSDPLSIPSNTTWTFKCLIAGRRIDGGGTESAGYEVTGVIRNDAGTTNILGSVTTTVIAESDASWDATATADNTNDRLQIRVTGASGKTINWVGRLELAEVTG